MTNEQQAAAICVKHDVSQMHIFKHVDMWRVFASRKNARGIQASVEEGRGADISGALSNLDARMSGHQINKIPFPPEFA